MGLLNSRKRGRRTKTFTLFNTVFLRGLVCVPPKDTMLHPSICHYFSHTHVYMSISRPNIKVCNSQKVMHASTLNTKSVDQFMCESLLEDFHCNEQATVVDGLPLSDMVCMHFFRDIMIIH